ncbi:10264_t:CDS:1 [Acaulospora colombiana]|uniref:10264_t:CDS:1 n=1 Tax=Acaulospora colombiana TaxID=27376 RepID=A0ACA9K9I2_9GLOM|nr:10264_t:CDS:1 [Acaulospora colombiana]
MNNNNGGKNFVALPLSKAAKRKRRRQRKAALEKAARELSVSTSKAGQIAQHSLNHVTYRNNAPKSLIGTSNARVNDAHLDGNYFSEPSKNSEVGTLYRHVGRLSYNESSNLRIQPSRSGEFTVNSRRDDCGVPSSNYKNYDSSSSPRLDSGHYNNQLRNDNISLRPTRSGVYSLKRSRPNEHVNNGERDYFRRPYSSEYKNKDIQRPLDDGVDYYSEDYRSPDPSSHIRSKSNKSKSKKIRKDPQMNQNHHRLNNNMSSKINYSQNDNRNFRDRDNLESDTRGANDHPSMKYMHTALIPSIKVEKSLPKLIVLDLNGTLIFRTCSDIEKAILRPYIKDFMDYIFSGGFSVMVWSSAQPKNVKKMVKATFGHHETKLIDVWTRDKFSLSFQQYHQKCLTIKDLEKVWKELNSDSSLKPCLELRSESPNTSVVWDQTNTILIDDSLLKAQLQPFNSIHLLEFNERLAFSRNDSELKDVIPYLEKLRHQTNVSAYIRDFPYRRIHNDKSSSPVIDLGGQSHSPPLSTASFARKSNLEKRNYHRFPNAARDMIASSSGSTKSVIKTEMDCYATYNKATLNDASYNSSSRFKQESGYHRASTSQVVVKSTTSISDNKFYSTSANDQQKTNPDNCKVS